MENEYKIAIVIGCDYKYVAKSIVALKQFTSHNPTFDPVIIGTKFSEENHTLCKKFQIRLIEIDLSGDFVDLDKRPYGHQYPIECFYHLYAYRALPEYDYIVGTEPDVYCNRQIERSFFERTKYVGGSVHNDDTILKFHPLMSDSIAIKSLFVVSDQDIQRLEGGLKIYNVKGLIEIGFYEEIVRIYQKSLETCPRCGDDSLFSLYQWIHPDYVEILDWNLMFINIRNLDLKYLSDTVSYHFVQNKYWDINKNSSPADNYFSNKAIAYLYDNFDTEFIKKYYFELYRSRQIIPSIITIEPRDNWKNWGDMLNTEIFKQLSGSTTYDVFRIMENDNIRVNHAEFNYIICGSILNLANSASHIWGAGFICADDSIASTFMFSSNQCIFKPKVHCVRGRYTRDKLIKMGVDCPKVFGDPALIFPFLYTPKENTQTKKYKYGFIPHYVDYDDMMKNNELKSNEEVKIIDIIVRDNNLYRVIDEVASCDVIFASSLHGVILGDMYSRKRRSYHMVLSDNLIGKDFKFMDYYSSINREYRNIDLNEVMDTIRNSDLESREWFDYTKRFDYEAFVSSCPFIDNTVRTEALKFFEKEYDFGPF